MFKLTEIEKSLIKYGSKGLSYIEISLELGYSERSIKRFFKTLRNKLRTVNDRQLFFKLGRLCATKEICLD